MLRLFLGVGVPSRWQKELFTIAAQVKQRGVSARWVPAENMHITLKFLGSCDENLPEQILTALSGSLSDLEPFNIRLGGLGSFPSLKRARVLWMGVTEGQDQMVTLASLAEEALASLGFQKENRRFHSHVTLARLRRPQDLGEIAVIEEPQKFEDSLIAVDSVILFKSTLTPKGAIYQDLGKAMLGVKRKRQ